MMTYEKLLQYSLRIIAKKRYTGFEMRGKLEKFLKRIVSDDDEKKDEISDGEIKVIARLEELKYLDDEQYARDYISTRLKLRPRGRFLLSRELKLKGIDPEITTKILNEQNINESEIAINALEKRMRQWETLPNQKQREKAFRFLSARGFVQDAIYKAINSCYHSVTEQNLN